MASRNISTVAARRVWISLVFAVVSGASGCAFAAGGPFGIDHRVSRDDQGIWNRNVQFGVEYGTIAVVVGGALWAGSEDRLGRTFWQAFDSGVLSSVTAEAGKHIFTRARPSQTDDANKFFQGRGHYSFPSGEVALVAGSVAPFVFEYGPERGLCIGSVDALRHGRPGQKSIALAKRRARERGAWNRHRLLRAPTPTSDSRATDTRWGVGGLEAQVLTFHA